MTDEADRGKAPGPASGPGAVEVSRLVLEALPIGIWTTDASGQVLYQNQTARRLLSLDPSGSFETLAPNGWSWNSLRPVLPEEWVWHRARRTGAPALDHFVALEREGGALASLNLSAVPIRGEDGLVAFVVVVGVDCSPLVASYDELRRTVSLLRTTLESVTNGVLVVDREGRIVVHNRLFAELWGVPDDVLAARDDTRALAVALERLKDPIAFLSKVRELYAKPLERSFDLVELKDGRIFERYSIPQLLDGKPIGRVWSFWDVTRRKREERAVQDALDAERHARSEVAAARERLAILSSVSEALERAFEDPSALAVAAGAPVPAFADWCILDALDEDGLLRRVAVAQADPTLAPVARALERIAPGSIEATKGPLAVLQTGRPELYETITNGELALVRASPEQAEVLRAVEPRSAICVPLSSRGRTIGTLTLLSSSTSGRHYDASDVPFALELGQRIALTLDNAQLYQRAREALKSRDDLLAAVSHDLRNPIAAVHASASLMLRRMEGADAAPPLTRRKSLELIQRSALHMDRLIGDLLDAARLETKDLAVARRPLDPRRLVEEMIEMEQPLAEKKGVALELLVAGPLPRIHGDRDRLDQVLANLIGNAIKFTPRGGRIVVSAARIESGVRFSVSDTGPGISAGDRAHIFDRYWQVKRTAGFGVGLGLSIAKGIVEAHAGEISVASTPGEGATFTFTIPAAPPLAPRAAA